MTCPHCDRPVTEYRVMYRKLDARADRDGKWLRTGCRPCKKFLGYRPAGR